MAEHLTSIEAVEGDITGEHVDAIVNAANSTLLGGGGVDGAIHRAAGPRLLEECRKLRSAAYPQGLPVGEAVATGAGDLPARWVIHTVGPNRHAGQSDPALLASCFESSLREAVRLGARSVAFPAVSAGVYGWDVNEVARIAVATVRTSPHLSGLDLVRFVLFSPATLDAFSAALGEP
jgi:O-acetyl-ADP-ribose deacetylase (regulator of RNase III)